MIQECPSRNEISEALNVLRNQHLHIYQTLFFQKPPLTQPGNGGIFGIERMETSGFLTVLIKVYHQRYPSFWFTVLDNAGMLDKIKLIQEYIAKCQNAKIDPENKLSDRACCPLAEHTPCVCIESFQCPLHGNSCHGSHD